MDGVGKSTVAKEIARKLGAKYVDGLLLGFLRENGMSPTELETIRNAISFCSDNENSIIRTWIYGFANLFNLMHYDKDVVIDRHCLTTFYYNGDEQSKKLYQIMQELSGKPDIVILLKASTKNRCERIISRNPNDSDLLNAKKMEYGYDKMEYAAEFLNLPYKVVDTDRKNLNQVIEEVMSIIRRERMELCWLTTEKCNQHCNYCDRFLEQGSLSTESYLNILEKLISYGIKQLTFGGGESLLVACFGDIVKKSVENGIRLKLVTNGQLIPQYSHLIPYFNEITLSLDAVDPSINEELGRGANHLDNVQRAISIIKSQNKKTSININTVVTKINLNEVKKMVALVKKWNINQWRIFRFCPLRGIALRNRKTFEITDKQFSEVCEIVKQIKLNCAVQFRNYEDMEKGYLLITPEGRLCVSREMKDIEVGDMLKDDLKNWF